MSADELRRAREALVPETPIDAFIGKVSKKPRRLRKASDLLADAKHEGAKLWREERCAELTPRHFVGVYAVLHEETYGVEPLELHQGNRYAGAVGAARRMLADEFGGDALAMADYVHWVWARERIRHKRWGGSGTVRGRLTWVVQFVAQSVLVDYRVAKKNTAKGSSPRRRAQ